MKKPTRTTTLNVEQTRRRIGCSRQHVYRLKAEGKIKGYRFGIRRGVRIYAESVDLFLQLQEEDC